MKNWYETFSFTPKTTVALGASDFPAGEAAAKIAGMKPIATAAVGAEIRAAEKAKLPVRGVGSRWSSGDVMATGGVAILAWTARILACAQSGQPWRNLSPVLATALLPDIAGSDRRFVHVEAGITVHALITALAETETGGGATRPPWCIPNMGASSGQTLAGAMATASHGGAFNRRPLADNVRAVRLVGPGGVDLWIEPGRRGITSDAALAKALPGVVIQRDDELFRASLVSVGSLGLITELVLEVAPMFGQSQQVVHTTWQKVCAALEDGSLFTSPTALGAAPPTRIGAQTVTPVPEGLEIFINPYRSDDDYQHGGFDRRCVVITRTRVDGIPPEKPEVQYELSGGGGAVIEFFQSFGKFIDIETGGPAQYRGIIDGIITSARATISKYLPTPTVLDTYSGGGDKDPGLSIELAITTAGNAHIKMMTDIFEAFDDLIRDGKKYAGFFSMRFTQPSKALLAMQNVDEPLQLGGGDADDVRRVCHVEVFALKEVHWGSFKNDGNAEGWTEAFLRKFVSVADSRGARLHWGQAHHLDRHRVAVDYAESGLHSWRRARTRLSRAGSWRTFSNSFTRRVGLESYHEALAAASPAEGRVDLFAYVGNRLRQLTIANDTPGAWTTVSVADDDHLAGPVTASVPEPNMIDVFAEADDRRIVRMRSANGAWTSSLIADPGTIDNGVVGPWTSTTTGGHLLGVDRRGRLLWRHDSGGKISAELVTPEFPPAFGGFVSQVAACVDGAGNVHVVGVGSSRMLLRGRHGAGGWTWGVIFPRPQPYAGILTYDAPIAVVATAPDHLTIFGVVNGQLYRIGGSVNDQLWDWVMHPNESIPPEPHYETIARDRGGEEAYLVFESQMRPFATPTGPVTAVHRGGRIDVFTRADTGAILWDHKQKNQSWKGRIRLPSPE
jgi:hypothetical protein